MRLSCRDTADVNQMASSLNRLLQNFQQRFQKFKSVKDIFLFVRNPFMVQANGTWCDQAKASFPDAEKAKLQLELTDLQVDEVLKMRHTEATSETFLTTLVLDSKYSHLRKVAFNILTMFGSTNVGGEEWEAEFLVDYPETPNWSDVEPCIKYLIDKRVQIDDVKCLDQVSNLKKFTESSNSDEEFDNVLAHQKWTKYFEKSKNIECHSELLKIAQFFFAIPSHNACRVNFFTDAKPMDKGKEQLGC
ncbi:unnamed protein product [Caretta caretta]